MENELHKFVVSTTEAVPDEHRADHDATDPTTKEEEPYFSPTNVFDERSSPTNDEHRADHERTSFSQSKRRKRRSGLALGKILLGSRSLPWRVCDYRG